MESVSVLLKLSLLAVTLMVLAGFLAPRGLFSIAAISLKPSLVAASLFLAVALFFAGAPIAGGFAAALAVLGTVFLLPFYKSSPDIQDADTTIVWANVQKKETAMANAVALAEREGAEIVMLGEAPLDADLPQGWTVRSERRPVLVLTRKDGPRVEEFVQDGRGSVRFSQDGIDIVGVHFAMPLAGRSGAARRHADFEILAAQNLGPRVLVIGDFNTVPWSTALHNVEDEKALRRLDIGPKTTWFSPLLFLGLPLDHALAGRDMTASARVGPGIGSDHRPLIVRAQAGEAAETPH